MRADRVARTLLTAARARTTAGARLPFGGDRISVSLRLDLRVQPTFTLMPRSRSTVASRWCGIVAWQPGEEAATAGTGVAGSVGMSSGEAVVAVGVAAGC